MILSLLFATVLSAQAQSVNGTPYLTCVKTCTAWADQPGFDLRKCVADCQSKYSNDPAKNQIQSVEPQLCESYEPECEEVRY